MLCIDKFWPRAVDKMAYQKMSGGCIVGSVRYAVSGEPFAINNCHYDDSRKQTGAPS